jgi:hypothetical protein
MGRVIRVVALVLAAGVSAALADEGPADERAALGEVLPKFQTAWNARDMATFIGLFHPDNPMRRAYEKDESAREGMAKQFKALQDAFGDVKSFEIRGYIAKKKRFVVRVTYEKMDVVAGTFAVRKNDEGAWCVDDFNIDGQGEPELKE